MEEASMNTETHPHQMTDIEKIRCFALAGNARLTLVSKRSGARFTYKIRKPEEKDTIMLRPPIHFVSVLTGPDNWVNYVYLGTIDKIGNYRRGAKSHIGVMAPSAVAFEWFWRGLMMRKLSYDLEVWHEGRCCRCGRALTVPESIEPGIGPKCAKRRIT
jgi:hypothetical protein